MKRVTTCALAALFASASPAFAGGLPDDDGGSYKDTGGYDAPAPLWTGFYGGIHGGYMWSDWDGPFSYDDEADAPALTFDHSDQSFSGDDWMGGLQIGANVQYDLWVVGVEADVSWTGAEGGTSFVPYPKDLDDDNSGNPVWESDAEIKHFGTVRARLGYLATPDLLTYATGGLAWAKVDSSLTSIHTPATGDPSASHASSEDNHIGWTAGAGVEWMFADNWSVKSEYLYYDLGEADYQFSGDHATDNYHPDLDGHIARVGINYQLN